MSLHYHQTTITPYEVAALHRVIAAAPDGEAKQTAYRWLCHARSGLFSAWQQLPDGDHLKEAYRDDTWTWDDQDIAERPDAVAFRRPADA